MGGHGWVAVPTFSIIIAARALKISIVVYRRESARFHNLLSNYMADVLDVAPN